MGQNPGEAEERGEDSAPGRGGWLGKSTRGETPFGQKMKSFRALEADGRRGAGCERRTCGPRACPLHFLPQGYRWG